jgi:hypothetical protein
MVKFYCSRRTPSCASTARRSTSTRAIPACRSRRPTTRRSRTCASDRPFYTAGLAEETKGLQEGTISDGEFIAQCDDVTAERMRMLDYALDRFDDGLLFFYFSSIDLRCHMMWRHIDESTRSTTRSSRPSSAARSRTPTCRWTTRSPWCARRSARRRRSSSSPTTASRRSTRSVNLNQWLYEQGYLVPDDAARAKLAEQQKTNPKAKLPLSLAEGGGLDRAKTKAYAVGFNGIYLNLKGREAGGIVDPADRKRLVDEIRGKLAAFVDRAARACTSCCARTSATRCTTATSSTTRPTSSWVQPRLRRLRRHRARRADALGNGQSVADNKSRWSGNHLMAPEVVPASSSPIASSRRRIRASSTSRPRCSSSSACRSPRRCAARACSERSARGAIAAARNGVKPCSAAPRSSSRRTCTTS